MRNIDWWSEWSSLPLAPAKFADIRNRSDAFDVGCSESQGAPDTAAGREKWVSVPIAINRAKIERRVLLVQLSCD